MIIFHQPSLFLLFPFVVVFLKTFFRFKDHPTLNERYLLLHLLGRGGFSEVYKVCLPLIYNRSPFMLTFEKEMDHLNSSFCSSGVWLNWATVRCCEDSSAQQKLERGEERKLPQVITTLFEAVHVKYISGVL